MALDLAERIAANLQRVRQRIEAAAQRAGRDPAAVTLVAVTKYVGLEEIRILRDLGVVHIGESRVQSLLDRAPEVNGVAWHMIGPLQRNKARRLIAVPGLALIHSIDSVRLAKYVDWVAGEEGLATVPALVEVNTSGEVGKHGVLPGELPATLDQIARLQRLEVRGLMTLAPATTDPEEARPCFRAVDELARQFGLPERSMGMSGDFEVAVEEGATLVRVGSALFEESPESL